MKAKELMIGDWVQGFVPDSYSTIYGIFNEGRIAIIAEPSKTYIELSPEDVQPIPLTPEILEKNGFKKIESETTSLAENWRWHEKVTGRVYNRCVGITFYKEPINGVSHLTKIETCSQKGDGVDQIHSCDIDYIHELQHALRICGITKEIQI